MTALTPLAKPRSPLLASLSICLLPFLPLAHEKVAENKGKLALMRGPVVYCTEGSDNKDIDLFKLSLPRSSDMTTEHDAKLPGGVTVIRAQGLDENKTSAKLTAIPYFA